MDSETHLGFHHEFDGVNKSADRELVDGDWCWPDALVVDPAPPEGLIAKEWHHCSWTL